MKRFFRQISPVYVLTDLFFIVVSFFVPYIMRYNEQWWHIHALDLPYWREHLFVLGLWAFFIVTGFRRSGLYETDRQILIPQEVLRVCLRVFYVSIIISAIIFYSKFKFFSRLVFAETFFMLCVTLSGWRVVKRLILRRLIAEGFHNINVLIIGAGKIGQMIREEIEANPQWGFRIAGFLDDAKEGFVNGVPVLGRTKQFLQVSRQHFVDEIVLTIPSCRDMVRRLMHNARKMHIGVRIIPENFAESASFLTISNIGVIPLLTYKERSRHPSEFVLKRIMDIAVSACALLILSPVFVVIALLIKRDSPGPVFYVQKRVGYKGRVFQLYKFRSMVRDAEAKRAELEEHNEVRDGVIFKIKKDPRVTRMGRFLRKYSLDEFPQFWNVLKGDMSLVGPRPPTPEEVERYHSHQMTRLSIRPGLTCLSQVKGRSQLTFKEWVKWDLWYINNWSFALDMQILLWTVPVVIKGKGAY
ncbi:MAG: sugar transferase [Candidatus Omnitrophota bacterium]